MEGPQWNPHIPVATDARRQTEGAWNGWLDELMWEVLREEEVSAIVPHRLCTALVCDEASLRYGVKGEVETHPAVPMWRPTIQYGKVYRLKIRPSGRTYFLLWYQAGHAILELDSYNRDPRSHECRLKVLDRAEAKYLIRWGLFGLG